MQQDQDRFLCRSKNTVSVSSRGRDRYVTVLSGGNTNLTSAFTLSPKVPEHLHPGQLVATTKWSVPGSLAPPTTQAEQSNVSVKMPPPYFCRQTKFVLQLPKAFPAKTLPSKRGIMYILAENRTLHTFLAVDHVFGESLPSSKNDFTAEESSNIARTRRTNSLASYYEVF